MKCCGVQPSYRMLKRFISDAFFERHVQVEIQPVDAQKHVGDTFLLKSRHSNLPQVVLPLKLSPLAGPEGPALVQNDSLGCCGNHRWGWGNIVAVQYIRPYEQGNYRNCLSEAHRKPRPDSFSFLCDGKHPSDLIAFIGNREMDLAPGSELIHGHNFRTKHLASLSNPRKEFQRNKFEMGANCPLMIDNVVFQPSHGPEVRLSEVACCKHWQPTF